ncbi:MAG: translocation and assembly module TamB [Psychromonas sp.]|jgi:translocation and assembly module TamB|uniref:translocation/assembly module TamB domain-containing protein n=1 Tax=Psychromonas sp. TaxID=1884585 RepID=UPI0039E67710
MSTKLKIKKIFRKTFLTLLLLIIFTVVSVTSILFTHAGTNLAVKLANKFEPRLAVTLDSGSLFLNPHYSNISWQSDFFSISFSKLEYTFDWSCAFTKICIEKLYADDMVIVLDLDKTEPPTEAEIKALADNPFTSLQLPIFIDIQSLILNNSSFILPGKLSVASKRWEIQAQGFKDNVTVFNSITEGLVVDLSGSENASKLNKPDAATEKSNLMVLNSLPALISEQDLAEISSFFNLDIKNIQISDFKLTQDDKQTLVSVNSAQAALRFFYSKLEVDKFTVDMPDADLELMGKVNFTGKYPLDLQLSGDIKDSKYLQPHSLLNAQHFSLKSSGDFSDLKTDLQFSNKISAQMKLAVNLLADNLPYSLTLDWQKLGWPFEGKAEYFSPTGQLSSQGKLNDYQLSLKANYELENIPGGKVDLKAVGDLQKLNVNNLKINTLNGLLQLTGLLDWSKKIAWNGQLDIKDIDLKQLETEYTGQFNGKLKQYVAIELNDNKAPGWSVSIPEMAVTGQFLNRPFAINGVINGNDKEGLKLNNVYLHNADNQIIINGKLAQHNDLTVAVDIKDLSHALLNSTGAVKGKVKIEGSMDAVKVDTDLQADTLRYQTSSLNSLIINGQLLLSKQPKATLSVHAEKLEVSDQLIDTIDINVKNVGRTKQGENHQIDLQLVSEMLTTDMQVQLKQIGDKWLTAVSAAVLNLQKQKLTLDTPFDVIIEGQNVQLTAHCWTASSSSIKNNGKLCLKKFNIGEANNIILQINSYLLAGLDDILPEEISFDGAVSADADIKWQANKKPTANIKIYSNDMKMKLNLVSDDKKIVEYPVDSFVINVISDQKKTDFSANISSKKLINAQLQGQLTGNADTPNIQANVVLDVPDFAPFRVLVPELEKLSGMLTANLSINGAIKNPLVKGEIQVTDTSIKAAGAPIQLHDLNTLVKINNSSATLEGYFDTNGQDPKGKQSNKTFRFINKTLSLVDTSLKFVTEPLLHNKKIEKEDIEKGKAYISGEFEWQDKFKGKVNLYGNKLLINDYSKIYLLVSPNLELIFDQSVNLSGKIVVDQGQVTVKELPAGAVTTSKDIVVVDIKKKSDTTDLPVIINLSVNLGDKLKIDALGLDTSVTGALLIRKRLDKDLTIHGDLKLVDGSYRALGQQLVLQNSRIIFQGIPESPYISIEAIRDPDNIEDDVTAGVRVNGTPDQLELVIFSDPSMSQQDALAYITRGKSISSSLNSQEDNQYTNMLINLGTGQTTELMGGIGNKVGISDFALTSGDESGLQTVGVSGRIAPNLEVSYGVGVFDSFTIFSIRYELFERFFIEASNGLDQAVDVYYQWDNE